MTYTPGQLVITPTNRIAKVVRVDEDGWLHAEYQDCAPREAPTAMRVGIRGLRPANEVTLVEKALKP